MELCDKYLHELLKINPVLNDFFLKDEFTSRKHIQPNIYSEDHYLKLYNLDKKYKKILEKKQEKTFYDKILLRDIIFNMHMETEYEIYMYMPVNYRDNLLIDYVTECRGDGYYLFKNRKDYIHFLNRLTSLPSVTKEIIKKMKNGIRNKVCLSYRTVDKMIENIQDILKNRLYKHQLKNKLKPSNWDESVQKYLVDHLEIFLDFLIKEYYPHTSKKIGLQSYRGGKNAYKRIIQYETLDGITPQQVYDLGWKELKRLVKEKEKLNIHDSHKHVYHNSKDILDDLKKIRGDLQKKIFPKYFHGKVLDKELYKIKKVSLENKHTTAYYLPGDLKGNKKGTFYINTLKPGEINKHELYVLSLHEGIPGHHLEISRNNQSDKPDYVKLGNTAYSEGWALYCENLGNYKNKYEYYFKLQYEILRSLRLILDTGIHYFGWDYDKCSSLMKKYLNYSDKQIERSILRYMDMPGQAITYKIGEKTFLYLRQQMVKQGHSIQDIHQIMLDIGPCPISMLI